LNIGYARVSTNEQNLDRQTDELQKYGVDELFTEKISGTITSRPELDKVKLVARENDVIIVESLSRLGRSSKDLLNLLDDFESRKIKVVSLKEQIDTATPTGKMLVTVLSALSQFERDIIVSRTISGLASARARGRVGGRPPIAPNKIEKAVKLYEAQTHSIKEISELTGVSSATLYRALKKKNQNTKKQ